MELGSSGALLPMALPILLARYVTSRGISESKASSIQDEFSLKFNLGPLGNTVCRNSMAQKSTRIQRPCARGTPNALSVFSFFIIIRTAVALGKRPGKDNKSPQCGTVRDISSFKRKKETIPP